MTVATIIDSTTNGHRLRIVRQYARKSTFEAVPSNASFAPMSAGKFTGALYPTRGAPATRRCESYLSLCDHS